MKKLMPTVERMEELKNILTDRYEELNHAKKTSEKMEKDRKTAEAEKAAEAVRMGTQRFQDEIKKLKNVIEPDKLIELFKPEF